MVNVCIWYIFKSYLANTPCRPPRWTFLWVLWFGLNSAFELVWVHRDWNSSTFIFLDSANSFWGSNNAPTSTMAPFLLEKWNVFVYQMLKIKNSCRYFWKRFWKNGNLYCMTCSFRIDKLFWRKHRLPRGFLDVLIVWYIISEKKY